MKRALLVIDVQNEYFTGKLPITYPSNSFQNILKVIESANKNKIPVILVQHSNPGKDASTFKKGSYENEIHEEVLKRHYDIIIEKNLPCSFTKTKLESFLKENNTETVTICGYMTQMCCDTTARQAMHMGFNVEFLSDATGTLDISNSAGEISAEELHKAILITQQMKFSQVMTTDDWIKKIENE
ncbi:cysteine hydrolase family protein [Methanobacterium sp. ACI-7]|uniref:cysteine hydrolase family protein n=1 Tax=unclassified Methanobacterium TaxID=2627676 RepID=UPI0039C0A15A